VRNAGLLQQTATGRGGGGQQQHGGGAQLGKTMAPEAAPV
jgi:hypothetical protein